MRGKNFDVSLNATIEKDVRERAREENERILRLRFVFSVAAAQPT